MTYPSNTSGLYCPGCQPGDFPQPHICGISTTMTGMGWCPLCHVNFTGGHVCPPGVSTASTIAKLTPELRCDHCWCLKQKAGWHDVPDRSSVFGKESRHLKPHEVCCNCGSRRVKVG